MWRKMSSSYPRKVLWLAVLFALLIILIGTMAALKTGNTNTQSFSQWLEESFGNWFGSALNLKADKQTLPADGKAQAQITVLSRNNQAFPQAHIASGGGTISRSEGNENVFIYTAGENPGEVVIEVSLGRVSDQITLKLVEASVPPAPTILTPTEGSTVDSPKPEIIGNGPANMQILITTDGNDNTLTRTDDQGGFKAILEKPLANGQHTIASFAINNLGIRSEIGNLVNITVETDPVTVDANNIRTSPRQIIAGKSFGLFVPVSLNTHRVTVQFEDRTYELKNLHDASIFTGTIAAPQLPGTYFGDLILFDIGGSETRFEKLLRFDVTSP